MNNILKDYIKLLECFDDINKFYWIMALSCSNSIKGQLIDYFNL